MTPEQIVTEWFVPDDGLSPTELVERIRAYGDERAAQERERAMRRVELAINSLPQTHPLAYKYALGVLHELRTRMATSWEG